MNSFFLRFRLALPKTALTETLESLRNMVLPMINAGT